MYDEDAARVARVRQIRRRKLVRGFVYLCVFATYLLSDQNGDLFYLTGMVGLTLLVFWFVTGIIGLVIGRYSSRPARDPQEDLWRQARLARNQYRYDRRQR